MKDNQCWWQTDKVGKFQSHIFKIKIDLFHFMYDAGELNYFSCRLYYKTFLRHWVRVNQRDRFLLCSAFRVEQAGGGTQKARESGYPQTLSGKRAH